MEGFTCIATYSIVLRSNTIFSRLLSTFLCELVLLFVSVLSSKIFLEVFVKMVWIVSFTLLKRQLDLIGSNSYRKGRLTRNRVNTKNKLDCYNYGFKISISRDLDDQA